MNDSRRSSLLQMAVSAGTIITMLAGVILYLGIRLNTGSATSTYSPQPAWLVAFRSPDGTLMPIAPANLDTLGHLGLTTDYIRHLPQSPNGFYQTGYVLSRDFSLSADTFALEASVKFDTLHAPSAPLVDLLIKGDKDYAQLTVDPHLPAMAMNLFAWQKIKIRSADGILKLFLNNKVAHQVVYNKKLGRLKEVHLLFNGIGSIDEIQFADRKDRPVLSQSF
jgi:hypothetical protein